MAKLPEGIFGPIIGTLGNVVGAKWKDIPYLRSLLAKSDIPATQAQINNREKFIFVNEFLKPFHAFITVGLNNKAKKMTQLNAAYSLNHNNIVVDTYPNLNIDYAKFIWSEGTLSSLNGLQWHLTDDNLLQLSWQQDYRSSAAFNDQLMLLVYCPALKIAGGFITGVSRADKQCSFVIPPKFKGHDVEIYVSVTSLNRKKIANSQYLGRVTLL